MGKKNEPPATPAAPSSEMRVDGTPIYRQWMEGSNTITDVYKTPFEKQQEQFFQSQLPQEKINYSALMRAILKKCERENSLL
jgi:hypothetical protein